MLFFAGCRKDVGKYEAADEGLDEFEKSLRLIPSNCITYWSSREGGAEVCAAATLFREEIDRQMAKWRSAIEFAVNHAVNTTKDI